MKKRKKTVSVDKRIMNEIRQVADQYGISTGEAAAMLIRLTLEKERENEQEK